MRMRMQETRPKRQPTLTQSYFTLKKARWGMMGVSEAVRCDVVRRVEDYDSNAVGVPRKRSA